MKSIDEAVEELAASVTVSARAMNVATKYLGVEKKREDGTCRYCGDDDACSVCGACGPCHALVIQDGIDGSGLTPAEALREFATSILVMQAAGAVAHGPDQSTVLYYLAFSEKVAGDAAKAAKARREEIEASDPKIDDDIWGDVLKDLFG